jgi:glycosyltransferase involved in cell wall biosynthesis
MHNKKPTEILFFTTQSFPPTGGFSRVIDALTDGIGSLGFCTRLLAPLNEDTPPLPYPVIPIRFFHNLYPLVTDYFTRYERIMELNLEILYQIRPFDLVHAHIGYPAGYCATRWGRRKQIPVIITCHGHDIKNVSDNPLDPDIWEKFTEKMIRGFHLAAEVTVPSRSMAQDLKTWGVESRCIPNGVYLDRIPRDHPSRECEPFILAIGRFVNVKGFDLLLKSFAIVARRRQNLRLVIFGEGCGISPLISHSLSNDLRGKVSFVTTGGDEKKKWSLLKQCELFVCSSRMEGFGIAVLEAMACSKPVVAFKVGGVTDLVENNKNGILVPPYDTEAMAEGIDHILKDRVLAKRMSEESFKRAVRFDWPIILKKYQHLYHEVLGGNAAGDSGGHGRRESRSSFQGGGNRRADPS